VASPNLAGIHVWPTYRRSAASARGRPTGRPAALVSRNAKFAGGFTRFAKPASIEEGSRPAQKRER
jgi:hypothetical protein